MSALRVIAPELPFELNFTELTENVQQIKAGGYCIEAFRVNHNVTCYGYTLSVRRSGRFLPEKAQENRVPKEFWSRLQKGAVIEHDGRTYTKELILGPERRGIKLTYCTDTRPVPAIVQSAAGADLFICEGMYGEKGKETKAQEHKHMTFYEAAALAKEAAVKELWLTHYSPSLAHPEEFIKETRKIFAGTYPGKDKKSVTLEFDKDE